MPQSTLFWRKIQFGKIKSTVFFSICVFFFLQNNITISLALESLISHGKQDWRWTNLIPAPCGTEQTAPLLYCAFQLMAFPRQGLAMSRRLDTVWAHSGEALPAQPHGSQIFFGSQSTCHHCCCWEIIFLTVQKLIWHFRIYHKRAQNTFFIKKLYILKWWNEWKNAHSFCCCFQRPIMQFH